MAHQPIIFRFYLLLSGLLLLIYCSPIWAAGLDEPGRFDFTAGQTKVEIPFYTFNNQVIIPVVVNDKVPLNFILDSGSPQAIFFDRKLAVELGIGFGRKIRFSGVGNSNNVTAFRARGVKLGLPGIEGNMMGMAILNSDYLDLGRFDIHGVIGYQLFVRFAVKIDYQRQILTLMEPPEHSPAGYEAMEVAIENSKPYVNTAIRLPNRKEVPTRLLVDTGGSFGLSLINGLNPDIQPPKKAQRTRVGSGLSGTIQGYYGTALLILNHRLTTESETIFIDHKDFSKNGPVTGIQGAIGNRLLKNFTVIFDYSKAKIFFQPNHQPELTRQ
jgi:hypothetical protein